MAINAGSVYSELILDTSKYTAGLQKAEQQMQGFQNKLQAIGGKMEAAGKTLTTRVTAPLLALGGLAAKSAIDFESAFAGVRKTVDTSEAGFAKLEKGIRGMSKEIPASATAIAGVAEAAGQLGIETDNILGFTRVMIDLGESTNLSADEAATALARLANITGMSQNDFDKLGSTIVALGNNLATTEAEIVAMGLRLAGAGNQIGLTEAQVMSFAGALSSVGIEADAGGSAFSKVMVDMQLAVETGSERLNEFANVAGISASEFSKAFKEDAAGAIITFIQGLGNAEEKGMSAIKILDDMGITEVRMRDALLRAAGASDVFTESLNIGTQAWAENNALTQEAEQRYKTTASQLEIAKNYLLDAGITIGEMVVHYIVKLAEGVKALADWFSNLNPATQKIVIALAGVAAAIGPVLVVLGMLASSVTAISAAIPILGAVFAALTGPIGLAVAAIAALVAIGITLYKNWDEIKAKLSSIWDSIKKTAEKVWNSLKDFFDKWGKTILLLATGPTGWAVLLAKQLGVNWDSIKNTAINIWNTIKSSLDNTWNSINSTASSVWNRIKEAIISPIRSAQDTLNGIIRSIQNAFSNMRITIPKPKLPHVSVSTKTKSVGGISIPYPDFDVSWYAKGTDFAKGGWAVVGEEGPELLNVPRGSKVVPNNKLGGVGGGDIIIQQMNVRNDNDIRLIARELYNLQQQGARGRGLATT